MAALANTNNKVEHGMEAEEAEAELDRAEAEVRDALEVRRGNNTEVALPIFVVDHASPTHLVHAPTTNSMIGTEDSERWIPPTPYNPRYENCNSTLMPRRRASSSFFDSSSLPDLSTSLSTAVSGGSGSPTVQKNAPEELIDEEEPIGADGERREEDSGDYEEMRSWLDCVAASGDVARMRRADRLAPRLAGYGIEGLEDIVNARKGSWSTSWWQGVWPPAAASSTCAPDVQEQGQENSVLPYEGTPTGQEQREGSGLLSDHSGFIAESTLAELQRPSTSESATAEAGMNAAPTLLFEDPGMDTGNSKPSTRPSARLSISAVHRPLIRSSFATSFATSHSNTAVPKKRKPGFVVGLNFKRKASKSFRKLLDVFGVREKPSTT